MAKGFKTGNLPRRYLDAFTTLSPLLLDSLAMPSLGPIVSASTLTGAIGRSLAMARGANPQPTFDSGSFQSHLDQAMVVRAGQPMSAVGADHQSTAAAFEERFRRLLRERGIELGDGVVLTRNAQGNIQVADGHAHKAAIEEVLREDDELKRLFAQLDAQASAPYAAESAGDSPQTLGQPQSLLTTPGAFSLAVLPRGLFMQLVDHSAILSPHTAH